MQQKRSLSLANPPGGSGGGGGDDGEEQPQKKPVFGWKGWQDRVAADPQFVYKVVIEQVRLGVLGGWSGGSVCAARFVGGVQPLDGWMDG